MTQRAHGFVDGAYLRKRADKAGAPWPDPRVLVTQVVKNNKIQSWLSLYQPSIHIGLARVTYYDGRPDEEASVKSELKSYWEAIEVLDDTDLGYGMLRGEKGSRTGNLKSLQDHSVSRRKWQRGRGA